MENLENLGKSRKIIENPISERTSWKILEIRKSWKNPGNPQILEILENPGNLKIFENPRKSWKILEKLREV